MSTTIYPTTGGIQGGDRTREGNIEMADIGVLVGYFVILLAFGIWVRTWFAYFACYANLGALNHTINI